MLPNAKSFQMRLMSVETVKLFTSDVQSVLLSRRYIYAVDYATDSLLWR